MTARRMRRYCPACGRWTLTIVVTAENRSHLEFRPGTTRVHQSKVPPRYSYLCDACKEAEESALLPQADGV